MKLIDFDHPQRNDWLTVRQVVVIAGTRGQSFHRRVDVVVFVNGLPLVVVVELKAYKQQIPGLFSTNTLLVVMAGFMARVGSLSADMERFMPWRTTDGRDLAHKGASEMETLVEGLFEHQRLPHLVRDFTVFAETGSGPVKMLAGYHQFHAVRKAVESTLRAMTPWQGIKAKVAPDTGRVSYGFAKYLRDALPNASFIGYTGTPIEADDVNTPAVFGHYINMYDIGRTVEDGATVPIYYESRLDAEVEALTEDDQPDEQERLKRKWATVESLVGSDKRIDLVAAEIGRHFEDRAAALAGKAMVVCMSRRICVALYKAIQALRPAWP